MPMRTSSISLSDPPPHSNGSETCQFWTDLGVEWTDPDNEECSGYIGEPVAVKKLLGDSFSYFDSFREALLAACQSADISRANLVLLLYGFMYLDREGFRSPFMKFAGAFPYSPE